MYADLLERLADDAAAGGPAAEVLAGHEDDPGPSALGLRLLGSVHRLVLERRAGALGTFYPSVGGSWEPGQGWAVLRGLLAQQPDAVREWLDRPPQTNEVGRAAALVGGLLHLPDAMRLPVRLHEIGASAGLNLLADRFGYVDAAGTTFGDPTSAVRLDDAWQGRALRPWTDLGFVERVGCDVMPVDARSPQGRLTLTAYVWADQVVRLERLRGALQVAARHHVEVRRLGAAELVRSMDLRLGAVTVLWHSVMWQYLERTEQNAVTAALTSLGERATADAPFVHLFLEPTRRRSDGPHEFLVVIQTWPEGRRRVLGTSTGHGVPMSWEKPLDAGGDACEGGGPGSHG